jgi:hypothetical protein
MTRRILLADAAKRPVVLVDIPRRRVDPNGIAGALGAAEAVPAPPGGGSPVHWYAVRRAPAAEIGGQFRRMGIDRQPDDYRNPMLNQGTAATTISPARTASR